MPRKLKKKKKKTEKNTDSYSHHAAATAAKSLQSCPTLCDPIDGSPPGSPVPGILQARVLEWGAIAFSEFSSYFSLILYAISETAAQLLLR